MANYGGGIVLFNTNTAPHNRRRLIVASASPLTYSSAKNMPPHRMMIPLRVSIEQLILAVSPTYVNIQAIEARLVSQFA
jgi:hypothetical protein